MGEAAKEGDLQDGAAAVRVGLQDGPAAVRVGLQGGATAARVSLQDGAAAARVAHTLDPIFDGRSRVLVLGTMPSPRSREVGFYYGHPQNRFWRVMERLHGLRDHELIDNDARRAFLLAHRIALWDVLAACDIAGASDASIANPEPNDLARILDATPIETVCTTGGKATQLCRRFDGPVLTQRGIELVELPSTSPANARMRLDDLVEAYRASGVFGETA